MKVKRVPYSHPSEALDEGYGGLGYWTRVLAALGVGVGGAVFGIRRVFAARRS